MPQIFFNPGYVPYVSYHYMYNSAKYVLVDDQLSLSVACYCKIISISFSNLATLGTWRSQSSTSNAILLTKLLRDNINVDHFTVQAT